MFCKFGFHKYNTNRIDGLHIYYKEIDIEEIRKIKIKKLNKIK
jgi:hypothetical protein